MIGTELWLFDFAQYFQPMPRADAMYWARITLMLSVLINPMLFHSMCALMQNQRRYSGWIGAAYVAALLFMVLIWRGHVIVGLKPVAAMDHYVHYNRAVYPLIGLHIACWQLFGAGLLVVKARETTGYKRTQLFYFIVAWAIVFLTTTAIMLPLEYDLNVPPFGFLVLPVNFAFMAYVMAKTRLADFNVVIARVLLHTVTLVVVVLASLVFIGGITLADPTFLNASQILFTISLVVVIGLALATGLPRFLPRAERLMQERMFGKRYGYQDALASLVKDLTRLPNIDEVLVTVATALHAQMQVARVLILMQDPLSGNYPLTAQSGLGSHEEPDALMLPEHSAVVTWLEQNRDTLVRDEIARRVPAHTMNVLAAEMNRLGVSVCVPMIVEERLTGLIGLGEKANRDMFFVTDLRLLETLATEVTLAMKYRRMEEQVFRSNKLIELGTIAAGVAHEIRNPLASIRTFAQLMPVKMDDPEFKDEFSKLVLKDVDRITKVIESMLAFARPTQQTIAEHTANELVEEALLLVQSTLKSKRIELTKQFHEPAKLLVDKQQILQVLINILNNATDALPECGKIRVATGVHSMDGAVSGTNTASSKSQTTARVFPRQFVIVCSIHFLRRKKKARASDSRSRKKSFAITAALSACPASKEKERHFK
jgi:signal transduction histidine kinase